MLAHNREDTTEGFAGCVARTMQLVVNFCHANPALEPLEEKGRSVDDFNSIKIEPSDEDVEVDIFTEPASTRCEPGLIQVVNVEEMV